MGEPNEDFQKALLKARLALHLKFPNPRPEDWPAVERWIKELSADAAVKDRLLAETEDFVLRPSPIDTTSTRRPPEVLDEFVIGDEIGRGGMATVHKAYDRRLRRWIAIKRPHPEASLGVRRDRLMRFEREILLAASCPHPGITAVYRAGTDAATNPYMVMEWMRGKTLKKKLGEFRDKFDAHHDFLMDVFVKVCQAVGAQHENRIAHGDISARNVMVGEEATGRVWVFDWGLGEAEAAGSESDVAERRPPPDGGQRGTPCYMAPEQFGGRVDIRTDVFLLGGLLCELLTGKPTYRADGNVDVIENARAARLEDAYARLKNAKRPELEAVARKCLSPGKKDRFADGSELALKVIEVRRAVEEGLRKSVERYRRLQTLVAAGMAALLAASVLVVLVLHLHAATREAAIQKRGRLHNQAVAAHIGVISIIAAKQHDEYPQAAEVMRASIQTFQELASDDPDEPAHAYELARCYHTLALLTAWTGPKDKQAAAQAEEDLRRAVETLDALIGRGLDAEVLDRLSGYKVRADKVDALVVERASCRWDLALVLIDSKRYSDAFVILDELWLSYTQTGRSGVARARPAEGELFKRAQGVLKPPLEYRYPGYVAADVIELWRDIVQMAAEKEQADLPWSRGSAPDHQKAMRLAARLTDSQGVAGAGVYNAACAFALAAAEPGLPAAEADARAGTAVGYLARLRPAGYFNAARRRGELLADVTRDLASLSGREPFRHLAAAVRSDPAREALIGGVGTMLPVDAVGRSIDR